MSRKTRRGYRAGLCCLGAMLMGLWGCTGPGTTGGGGNTPGADDAADEVGPPAPDGEFGDVETGGGGEGEGEGEGNPPGETGDAQSGTLTAGSFDDNLNPGVFEQFVSDTLQTDPSGALPDVVLGDRAIVAVIDEASEPVGDARVVVSAATTAQQTRALLDVRTRSDGRALFSTGLDGADEGTDFTLTVYPPDGSEPAVASVDLADLSWEVTLTGTHARTPAGLDLAFVVDATGSMGDELEYLKVEMSGIVASVNERFPEVAQRYALIVYRDQGDDYVTRTFDFTEDLDEFVADLSDQAARGGGDYPEAMDLALEEAVGLSWNESGTARVLFLIADAPPHAEHYERALEAVMALRTSRVAIYPVAASGVATEAELVMRTAALVTLCEYCFLTDDSGVGLPHAEPHIPCYAVQRLDTLMVRMIESELAGERIYPEAEDVLRTIGNPVDGICMEEDTPVQ